MNVDEPFTQSGNKSATPDYSALRKDIETLRKDLSALSKTMLDDTRSGVKGAFDKAYESSNRTMHQAEEKIRERPFLSLLVSFLLGLILAKMLERS